MNFQRYFNEPADNLGDDPTSLLSIYLEANIIIRKYIISVMIITIHPSSSALISFHFHFINIIWILYCFLMNSKKSNQIGSALGDEFFEKGSY